MRLKNLDKIRLLTILPLSLAFIVFGSIILSETQNSKDDSLLNAKRNSSFTTEIEEISAQENRAAVTVRPTSTLMPEPPSPTPIPTTVPEPPSPTPTPTSLPPLSCTSNISYSGSGQNLLYFLQISHIGADSRTFTNIDLRPYLTAGQITLEEYTSNCSTTSTPGLIECKKNPKTPILILFKVTQGYSGDITLKVDTEKSLLGGGIQADSCNATMTVSGINTPPGGMPPYSGGGITPYPSQVCEPMREYCNPADANLLDDVIPDFNQSHDGSFENPICTLNPPGSTPQINGQYCTQVGDRPTYYQADTSALIPLYARAFFVDTGDYQRPEYIRQEVAGSQQCEEKLTAHGNNSFKMFSRRGFGIKGGLCLPMKVVSLPKRAGINFRVSQQTNNVSENVPVTFKLGFSTKAHSNNFYFGTMPDTTEEEITWTATQTITSADYGGEGAANRYAGGFLEGQLGASAKYLCFMAESGSADESEKGNGINTFWDAAFAYIGTDTVCENALEHSDGIDRSCGGYACGNSTYSGNFYTDTNQEEYAFDMPVNWQAKQCQYETESNGADSPYGALFIGLDLNNCDKNYSVASQREINPNFDCVNKKNWTYGYSWTGGIKDFGLLQYLDCALTQDNGEDFKGTKNNPYFCSQILKSYSNTKNVAGTEDPGFTIRYSNTYSGLVKAIQAEGNSNFWKVPLLGSAIANGVINNQKVEELKIDPFLISKRNSGNGLNNVLKFSLKDFVISQILRTETHIYEGSTIPQNEVMIGDLLANGPVCNNIQGDPITKIHYGSEDDTSDRAVFGFADDGGSFEHIIKEENFEISPKELCNYQFNDNRVVGAECTFENIGDGGRDVTFTEDNIGSTLEQEGLISRLLTPTLSPPNPPGIPLPGFDDCPSVNLCGASFECGSTMRQLYDQCIGNREVSKIGGDPFIRWERPNGWRDLQVPGLNKVMDSTWHNEFIHYAYPIRHENVGIDINQVVSVYDQQQPKCSQFDTSNKPTYCSADSTSNKAAQVCRRVSPYDCGCNASNFATCLMDCKQMFRAPALIEQVGISLEGTVVPTLPPGPDVIQPVDGTVRSILENSRESFLEKFVSILKPKTYEGEGAKNYIQGEVYTYEPHYEGGFLLANTGSGVTQCTTDTSAGSKTGASQVRIENYFAYAGQLARINERIGFAATNNKDEKTLDQLEVDLDVSSAYELQMIIESGGIADPHIALPYCDLLTEERKEACTNTTDVSCDCIIRSCEQQHSDRIKLAEKYVPDLCKKIIQDDIDSGACQPDPQACTSYWVSRGAGCVNNLISGFTRRSKENLEECSAIPKTNLNYNCDPMASYLISQGFDTPELRLAACDEIVNQCSYDKFGVHLIKDPLQEANYARAEELGLGWKMEVITDDTEEMETAMVNSVDSFSGKSIFRFCNADQGPDGSKVRDQSCQFRVDTRPEFSHLPQSTEESARKVARMVMNVARRTSKGFIVSPINEPISEHWYGGDPNDVNHTPKFDTTMPAVSAFYLAFINELNTDQTVRSKIEVGGPTFNVTSFGNFDNFTDMYNQFEHKDLVDFHTVTMYNNNDLPEDFRLMEAQFAHVKEIITSKPIALNETGDFQHDLARLEQSYTILGEDSRMKYALMFNAFGGLSDDDRAQALILTNAEIKQVLRANRECNGSEDNICVQGGIQGLIVKAANAINSVSARIIPEIIYAVGVNENLRGQITGNPNQIKQTEVTLLIDTGTEGDYSTDPPVKDGKIGPPCTGAYETTLDAWFEGNCEYDIRGVMQFQNFTFYNIIKNYSDQMTACTDAIGVDYTVGMTPEDTGMKAMFEKNGEDYSTNKFSRYRVGDNICAAAIYIANAANGSNGGSDITPEEWRSLAGTYNGFNPDHIFYRVAKSYLGRCINSAGDYCDRVSTQTKELIDNNTFGNIDMSCEDGKIASPECLVNPLNHKNVSQCYGETNSLGPLNAHCLSTFPDVELSNINYETTGFVHSGIDLVDNSDGSGRDVYAAGPGEVVFAGLDTSDSYGGGYGNYIKIKHDIVGGEPLYTRYAHLESIDVTVGQIVDNTVKIGTMGESGNADGIHLHFELLDGEYMNLNTIQDPTDIVLRDRTNPPLTCESTEVPTGCIPFGTTAEGHQICMYQFGDGAVSDKKILLVGAVHGGYEPNTIVLGYEMLNYFKENPEFVTEDLTVFVIPALNIDGQETAGLGTGKVTSLPEGFTRNPSARYNGNGVDINRNFDCNWTANPEDSSGVHEGRGGTAPFSEPEATALADFIDIYRPDASIFWHSVISGGKAIAGSADCSYDYLDAGQEMAELYADQAGYGTYEDGLNPFPYTITGDMTDWMAKIGLVGISVELPTWNDSGYAANLQATLKIIEEYGH